MLPGPIGVLLGTLHRDRPLVTLPSVYASIESEAKRALDLAAPPRVVDAARGVLALPADAVEARRSPRGHLTHGDPKLANAVLTPTQDAVLIDWDKACSVSPELDVVLAMYSFGTLPEFSRPCRGFLEGYLLGSDGALLDPATLELAVEVVADLFTLHDWIVARRSGSPMRWAYWEGEVEPLAIRWSSELGDVALDTLTTLGFLS